MLSGAAARTGDFSKNNYGKDKKKIRTEVDKNRAPNRRA